MLMQIQVEPDNISYSGKILHHLSAWRGPIIETTGYFFANSIIMLCIFTFYHENCKCY